MTTDQELCLAYARELKDEIDAAIHAIADDHLDAFEESLWKQQVLCVSLRRLLEPSLQPGTEAHARTEIQRAILSLQELNRTYMALVRQSRSSCELLSKLCLSYTETSRDNSFDHASSRSARGLACTV